MTLNEHNDLWEEDTTFIDWEFVGRPRIRELGSVEMQCPKILLWQLNGYDASFRDRFSATPDK